jgi:hypothetical protein
MFGNRSYCWAEPIIAGLIFLSVGLGVLYLQGVSIRPVVAITALTSQGYDNVYVTNKAIFAVSWRGCTHGDVARFTAVAQNLSRKSVEVYVCASFPTGATVRTP